MTKLRAWWRGRPRRRWCPECEVSAWLTPLGWQKHQAAHRLIEDLKTTYLNSTR